MDARSDRDAWNSDRLWAVEQMSGQHWPIELCIAWVAERSKEEAVAAWLSFRFGRGPSDAWASAQHTLVSELCSAHLASEAADTKGERTALTDLTWRNLNLRWTGAHFEARSAAGIQMFRHIRISARSMLSRYPARSAADNKLASSAAKETAAITALVELMRADPFRPKTKAELRRREEFRALPERAFDRAFRSAVETSGAHAWRKAGRRAKGES